MLYMVTFTINIPQMLAYIYHTWILFVWYGMQWNASFMANCPRGHWVHSAHRSVDGWIPQEMGTSTTA